MTLALLLASHVGVGAQVQPDPGGTSEGVAIGTALASPPTQALVEGRFASRCLEPRDPASIVPAIGFEGRRFEPSGGPEPVSANNLDPVGEHRGVPLFAGKLASRPLVDLWVPVCAPPEHYQLYTRLPSPAGT